MTFLEVFGGADFDWDEGGRCQGKEGVEMVYVFEEGALECL